MFSISKNIWLVLGPINFLVILICIALFLRLIKKDFWSNIFFMISVVFFIVIAFLPTGSYLLYKLESPYQSQKNLEVKIDGLLILGGPSSPGLSSFHQQVSFNEAGERLTESVKVIKNFSNKEKSICKIERIGPPDNPIPSTRELAKYCYPNYLDIIKTNITCLLEVVLHISTWLLLKIHS